MSATAVLLVQSIKSKKRKSFYLLSHTCQTWGKVHPSYLGEGWRRAIEEAASAPAVAVAAHRRAISSLN